MHFVALADAWASWLESIVDFFSFGTTQLQPLYRTIFLKKKKKIISWSKDPFLVCVTFAMAQPVDISVAGALEIKLHAFSWSNLRQWNAQGSLADLPA